MIALSYNKTRSTNGVVARFLPEEVGDLLSGTASPFGREVQ